METMNMNLNDYAQAQHDMFMAIVAELHHRGLVDARDLANRMVSQVHNRSEGVAAILEQVADLCRSAPAGPNDPVN